jgi:hypothetical protein
MLGTNWLNKIGTASRSRLVCTTQNLGPAGKYSLVSAWRRHDCRRSAPNPTSATVFSPEPAPEAGLLYFVSYAVYHVPAAHVTPRELDFFPMFFVAAAIVAYSLLQIAGHNRAGVRAVVPNG